MLRCLGAGGEMEKFAFASQSVTRFKKKFGVFLLIDPLISQPTKSLCRVISHNLTCLKGSFVFLT
jgi:hypothetical protein